MAPPTDFDAVAGTHEAGQDTDVLQVTSKGGRAGEKRKRGHPRGKNKDVTKTASRSASPSKDTPNPSSEPQEEDEAESDKLQGAKKRRLSASLAVSASKDDNGNIDPDLLEVNDEMLTFQGGSGQTGYKYPYTPWEDLFDLVDERGKPSVSIAELARSAILTHHGDNKPVNPEDLGQRFSEAFPYFVPGRGRWEKTLRDTLREYFCFIGYNRPDSKTKLAYSCDPTINPILNRTSKKRAQQKASKARDGGGGRGKSKFTMRIGRTGKPTIVGSPLRNSLRERGDMDNKPEESLAELPEQSQEGPEEMQTRDLTALHEAERVVDDNSGLVFEFETSAVFEVTDRHRDGEVFYCMMCGPFLIRRRRVDGQFILTPLLRLIKLAFGSKARHEAAQKLFDLEEDAEVSAMLLVHGRPTYASLSLVREVAEQSNLLETLSAILDNKLPDLPLNAPITRSPPSHIYPVKPECRYCETKFTRWSELDFHMTSQAGTCQLDHALSLRPYLHLLNTTISQEDFRETSSRHPPSRKAEQPFLTEAIMDKPMGGTSLPPSLTYWTPSEKDKLFHGLQRSSRFRPDLIAEHVGSKNASEVVAYLAFLEEQALLLDGEDEEPALGDHPAAREMSDKWIAFEENMAEDAVVWEAFICSASKTPRQYRDYAQAAAMHRACDFHCRRCPRGTCDGEWPICGRCDDLELHCKWSDKLHPDALPDELDHIKQPLRNLLPQTKQTDLLQAIQDNLLDNLNWHHLSVLDARPVDLESQALLDRWHKYSDPNPDAKSVIISLRSQVSDLLQDAGLGHLPVESKEFVYQKVKGVVKGKEQQVGLTVELVAQLAEDAIPGFSSDRKRTTVVRKPRQSTTALAYKALSWTEVPLAYCVDQNWRNANELAGIKEEIQQASNQLKTASIDRDVLGEIGQLFNLRRIGALMDLYRFGTDDTAHVSNLALAELYMLVREHVTRLVVSTACIAAVRGVDVSSSKTVEECAYEAIRQERTSGNSSTKYASSAAFLASLRSGHHGPISVPANLPSRLQATPVVWTDPLSYGRSADEANIHHALHNHFADSRVIYNKDTRQGSEDLFLDEESDDETEEESEHDSREEERLEGDDKLEDHLYEDNLWEIFDATPSVKGEVALTEEDLLDSDDEPELEAGEEGEKDEPDGDQEGDLDTILLEGQSSSSSSDSEEEVNVQQHLRPTQSRSGSTTRSLYSSDRDMSEVIRSSSVANHSEDDMEIEDSTVMSKAGPSRSESRSHSRKQSQYRTSEFIDTSDEED